MYHYYAMADTFLYLFYGTNNYNKVYRINIDKLDNSSTNLYCTTIHEHEDYMTKYKTGKLIISIII